MAFDAVVTDLDGTVVRADGTVSAATLQAAHALSAAGVPLLAATARTPTGVAALTTLAPHLAFAVCCSGAVGWVPGAPEPAWCELLPRAEVADLVAFLTRELPTVALAAYDSRRWRMTATYQAMRPNTHKGPITVVEAAALPEAEACTLVLGHPDRTPEQLVAALIEGGFDPTRLGLHRAGRRFVEVTAAPIDKASGVLRALRVVGADPARTIAFGDMPIDTTMFAVVGRSVAMAGAPPEVLAAATDHTASVEDDGFARALTALL
ncbi:Cof-type HAD-IIB family hydrolase [Actinoplanes sp. TRM 88003]|uniref:Cof-type HAD-IIB family hydrolase n=1 Tax=Paractinoplanes aksuensis TaxID=2939490 RepID=A0ABT1E1C8_9ACTN|nr:HAD family hydrolase [Actinoplanes aksuensis]MCO8276810.1 Cof-type HAD-IIB family hydrolase [Actinoplanes aksuensis]